MQVGVSVQQRGVGGDSRSIEFGSCWSSWSKQAWEHPWETGADLEGGCLDRTRHWTASGCRGVCCHVPLDKWGRTGGPPSGSGRRPCLACTPDLSSAQCGAMRGEGRPARLHSARCRLQTPGSAVPGPGWAAGVSGRYAEAPSSPRDPRRLPGLDPPARRLPVAIPAAAQLRGHVLVVSVRRPPGSGRDVSKGFRVWGCPVAVKGLRGS